MLNRFDGNVVPFASEATLTNRTVFGAETQSDDIDDNLNADFKKGWEIVGLNDNPTREDFNAMGYTLGNLISYLYQSGVAEYNADQEYYVNSLVMGNNGVVYQSLSGTEGSPNVGNNPISDDTNWKLQSTGAYVIDTVDDFGTVPSGIDTVIVKDMNRGGTFIYDATQSAVNNGGTVFDGWVRQYSGAVNVKWFGAKGDNISDDTIFINKAIALGGGINFSRGTYKITNSLYYNGNTSIFINGGGATLNVVATEISSALVIRPLSSIDFCSIKNLKIDGNNITNCGIYVDTLNFRIADIRIDDNSILNLNNVNGIVSVIGIRVDASNCSTLDITSNFIYNLNRTKVNPGIIATVGIHVSNLMTQANINGNSVNGVFSPSGDADADGIKVSSNNSFEEDVRQTSSPIITGNRINQVKGRFIKLQCSNGKINNNCMENKNLELIENFTGIDAQTGGVLIAANTIRIGAFTGGNSLSIFNLQMKNTGDWENIYSVSNNQITIEQNIKYCCLLTPVTRSNGTVLIEGNIIQDHTNTKACANFAYVGVAADMSKYTIKLNDNIVPLGDSGSLFRFYTGTTLELLVDSITGPLISEVLKIHITNNISSLSGVNTNLISNDAVGGKSPYLQYLTILGNSYFTRNGVMAQGMDIAKLPDGTSFFYATDGTGTGGLINAPAGFNRYVSVESPSKNKIVLTAYVGSSFAIYNKVDGTAYRYNGTVV